MFKRVEKYKWRWTRTLGRHRVLADNRLDNELFWILGVTFYSIVIGYEGLFGDFVCWCFGTLKELTIYRRDGCFQVSVLRSFCTHFSKEIDRGLA